jgi:Fe-Mn family superoxide dismutase
MPIERRILNRREMIRVVAATAAVPLVPQPLRGGGMLHFDGEGPPTFLTGPLAERYPFTLPTLPYAEDHLEAAIDARTMEIHHGRHHQGYVNKLNAALEGHAGLQERTLVQLVAGWSGLPEGVRTGVRNSGGGHLNHSLFWPSLSPEGGGQPEGRLGAEIRDRFGSFPRFQEEFSSAAGAVFGSGWGWLVASPAGTLEITSTPNQDNPVSMGMTPLLGLDVWEHAYYLRYQNRRGDYIKAFWEIVRWEEIGRRFDVL